MDKISEVWDEEDAAKGRAGGIDDSAHLLELSGDVGWHCGERCGRQNEREEYAHDGREFITAGCYRTGRISTVLAQLPPPLPYTLGDRSLLSEMRTSCNSASR